MALRNIGKEDAGQWLCGVEKDCAELRRMIIAQD
jgi:hypothetical protein